MDIKVRTIIGPCRGGTTMLTKAFSENSQVEMHMHPVKNTLKDTGKCDYSIYGKSPEEAKIIVTKESIGYATHQLCTMNPFPFDVVGYQAKPIFIFRNPVHVWNSWFKQKWGSLDRMITAYSTVIELSEFYKEVSMIITYDEICENPRKALIGMCEHWDITFEESMISWKSKPGEGKGNWGPHFETHTRMGTHSSLMDTGSIKKSEVKLIIDDKDTTAIENHQIYNHYKSLN